MGTGDIAEEAQLANDEQAADEAVLAMADWRESLDQTKESFRKQWSEFQQRLDAQLEEKRRVLKLLTLCPTPLNQSGLPLPPSSSSCCRKGVFLTSDHGGQREDAGVTAQVHGSDGLGRPAMRGKVTPTVRRGPGDNFSGCGILPGPGLLTSETPSSPASLAMRQETPHRRLRLRRAFWT
jgi:hypothetical protein